MRNGCRIHNKEKTLGMSRVIWTVVSQQCNTINGTSLTGDCTRTGIKLNYDGMEKGAGVYLRGCLDAQLIQINSEKKQDERCKFNNTSRQWKLTYSKDENGRSYPAHVALNHTVILMWDVLVRNAQQGVDCNMAVRDTTRATAAPKTRLHGNFVSFHLEKRVPNGQIRLREWSPQTCHRHHVVLKLLWLIHLDFR